MSQHYFKSMHQGRPVQILMGWDRPLQGFFMVVERLDATDDDVALLYSNLDDDTLENAHPDDLAVFQARLTALGLTVPDKMLEEIRQDQAANVGNKVMRHT